MVCSMASKSLTLTVNNSVSPLSSKILKQFLFWHKQASLVYSSHWGQTGFQYVNSTETSELKQVFLSLAHFAKKPSW